MVLCGSVMGAKQLPAYNHLFSWNLTLSDNHPVEGPLGTRYGLGIIGGVITAPNGTAIAKLVPGIGGETGVIDKNGNLQVEARAFFQFLDDKKYAYLIGTGIGSLVGHPFDYQRIETDSPSRLAWNSYFIVANLSLASPTTLLADAFAFSTGP
ncbi:hypothetical protein BDV93DRAFT_525610 [Ceratobasidium sp. AG-I]|nr:hypothetical protein BDV93DRAFT_525610 [Ceratobasidium sp. AG-I]